MPFIPALRCVLQHWYELRPSGSPIGSENNKRLTAIANLHSMARRRGIAAVRGAAHSMIRGEQPGEPLLLIVAGGLFPDDTVVEAAARSRLRVADVETRIASTYATSFFLWRSEELTCTLVERTVLEDGDRLILLATRDVLAMHRDAQLGACSRCGCRRAEGDWFNWLPKRLARGVTDGVE